jgi:lipocalin-like protein
MRTAIALLGLLLATEPSFSADRAAVVGVWKLLSFETEFQDGSPRRAMYGAHPSGYLILTREGRMMAIVEGEGRKTATTDAGRAALLSTLFAYSGTYKLEGDKWITNVDVAWNPAWKGTEQSRTFELSGDRLTVTTMWEPDPNSGASTLARGVLVWQRVK